MTMTPASLAAALILSSCWMIVATAPIILNIVEEVQMGLVIGNLKELYQAENINLDSVKPLKFNIMGRQNYLKLNKDSGKLSVAQRIDRDRLCEEKERSCCSRELGQCHIPLRVQIHGKDFFKIIFVNVFVADINDNTPKWSKSRIDLRVAEEAGGKQIITIRAAFDPDLAENGTHTYTLNDPTNTFAIITQSPPKPLSNGRAAYPLKELSLQVRKRLDRERKAFYNMTLTAVDGRVGGVRRTGSVSIMVDVVDINDHSPSFKKTAYEVSILESAPLDDLVLRVEATDLDAGSNARIRYQFSSSTSEEVRRTFRLDKSSGEVRLQGQLNYEEQTEYKFTITASDDNPNPLKNSTQVTILVIDENDCTPQIIVFSTKSSGSDLGTSELSVEENSKEVLTIGVVSVSDGDSGLAGKTHCSLTNSEHLFQLVGAGEGQYMLNTRESFDREKKSLYHLVIRCMDSGLQPNQAERRITVKVTDKNDVTPVFVQPSYTFYVSESKPSGHQIGRVKAIDGDISNNGQVRYKLVPLAPSSSAEDDMKQQTLLKDFDVDPISGMLSCQKELDRETLAEIKLAVVAYDSGSTPNSATAEITVIVKDENDNVPRFNETNYRFRLKENSEAGSVVGRVWAEDDDEGSNAALSFEIDKRKGPSVPFIINKVNRVEGASEKVFGAELMTKQKIDREQVLSSGGSQHNTLYVFDVIVTDHGLPRKQSKATVTVEIEDVNDRAPEWVFPGHQNTWVNVTRYAEVGHPVAIVKAVDKDAGNNAKIHYFIVNGDTLNLFILDPNSGALQIRRRLDEKDRRKYNLVLKAQDNPGGLKNETQSKTTVLKVRLVDTGPGGGGSGRANRRDGSEGRNMTIILALVGCTATIAFILILIIVITRLLVMRRPRTSAKAAALRRGPSTLSHIGGPGIAYQVDPIFSMHTKSQSGHTLADANSNKQEMVYYSAEGLDHEDHPSMTLKQHDRSKEGTKVSSMDALCDMNRSWLSNARLMGNATNTYVSHDHHPSGPNRYDELDVREYTALHNSRTLNRLRSDSIGHYYDLVKSDEQGGAVQEEDLGDYSIAGGRKMSQPQQALTAATLRGRSLSNLDKRAFLQQQQSIGDGTWRGMPEGKVSATETSEMLPGGIGGDNQSTQDLANYRARAKQSLYQASFV